MRIFLIGFMGSGKSTWGKWIAEKMGYGFFDLDTLIENRANLKINDIFDLRGEDFFREMEAGCLRELMDEDDFVLACGGGTPCFHDNMRVMNSLGTTVWLNTPKQVLASRLLGESDNRPLVRGLSPAELQAFIDDTLDERLPFYAQAKIEVDPIAMTPDELIKKLVHA
jgi:shikimate kinase